MPLTTFHINTMFIGNAFRFFTKQLHNHSFVNNNNAAIYIAEYINLFYIFTTTSSDSDSQRCELQSSVATSTMLEIQSFESKNSTYSLDLVIVYTMEL